MVKARVVKPISYKNKQLVADMAKACDIPREDARKIVEVIINCVVKSIKKYRKFKVKDFGTFTQFATTKSFGNPKFKGVKCIFKAAARLKRIVNDPEYRLKDYAGRLRLKLLRLISEGDIDKIKKAREHLLWYISDKPKTAAWVESRGGVPDLPKCKQKRS